MGAVVVIWHKFSISHFTREIWGKTRKIESESDIFLQILSEIIEFQENGSRGINLAQISNWLLLMGIDA